jgi:hypothetical protein
LQQYSRDDVCNTNFIQIFFGNCCNLWHKKFCKPIFDSPRHHFFIKLASTDQNKTVQALQFYKRVIRFVL